MTQSTQRKSFFENDGSEPSVYHPTIHSRGPWDPGSLHGRVISGLIAYEAERNYSDKEEMRNFRVTRMTVDMFRLPPMTPLRVTGEVIRTGRRIKVLDIQIKAITSDRGDLLIARGSVVLLKKTDSPPGIVWTSPTWDVQIPNQTPSGTLSHKDLSEYESVFADPPYEFREVNSPIWETIELDDGPPHQVVQSSDLTSTIGRRRAWVRETHNLIAGELPSPLVRVAQVADAANPFANSGTDGLNFINADVSLYLHRYPQGDWIGTESFYHGADDGLAVGTIALYDQHGKLGTASVCALGQILSKT